MKRRLIIATTVPETFATILRYQPRHLSQSFAVSLATSPGPELAQVAHDEGLDIHTIPMSRGINIGRDIVSLARMIALLLRERPHVVHSYTPKAGLICMLAAWVCRVPVRVHTFTGLVFPTASGLMQRLLIWIDRLICACATSVVPEGQGVAADLRRYSITSKPLRVIGHGNIAGVDTAFFAPTAPGVAHAAGELRHTLLLPPDAFVFCFVGRLNKDKGLGELVKAFEMQSSSAYLLLVGALDATAPVSNDVLSVIEGHPRIRHLGFLSDIRPALYLSDVLTLPSYREGFPNVLLQAGAMKTPALASDINGCNELLEAGYNGWLVPAKDISALAAGMRAASDMGRGGLKEMGARARARVMERFERREHWERMVAFYDDVSRAGAPLEAKADHHS